MADVQRSTVFYARWLGFDRADRAFPDGTVFVRDAEGTDLAFHEGNVPDGPSGHFHFGFRRRYAHEVRDLHGALVEGGVEIVEHDDLPEQVSVKLKDPDGYVVEVYWEPDATP